MPEAQATALESFALGAEGTPTPCGDALRAAVPEPPADGPPVGVTLSGGGFRATFAALGTIRFLADAGLLHRVRYASSVSGGSIANGLLACAWPQLRDRRFTAPAVDELLVEPLVRRLSTRSLKRSLLLGAWRALGSDTRTDVLARRLDEWFFGGVELERLDPQVRWIVNAANLVTGVRFAFERDVVGDYVTGLAPTAGSGLRLAQAVAASAAVPGTFAPWRVPGVAFPCAAGVPPVLLDGGVYDNTGLEAIDGERYRHVFLVTMNAGGLLRVGRSGRVPLLRDLARANALLYRQSTGLRTRWMVERFRQDERQGVLVGLATRFAPAADEGKLPAFRAAFEELRAWQGADLAHVPTVFDRLPEALCRRLVHRGWWVTGAALARHHPTLAPDPAGITPPAS